MAWKLASTTGRWLLAAGTGLWKLCTCCTASGCDTVFLINTCKPLLDDGPPCLFADEKFYLCSDATVDGRTVADILASGDVLKVTGGGCYYISESVPFDDMPAGTVLFPHLATTEVLEDVTCDDAPCDPDYSQTCSCICWTSADPGVQCCYGFINEPPAPPRWEYTEHVSIVYQQYSTQMGTIDSNDPCAADCAANSTCEVYRYECETIGGPIAELDDDVSCSMHRAVRSRVPTSKGCCSSTNAPTDWSTHPMPGALSLGGFGYPSVTGGCPFSCFGGAGTSGEIIYSELDGCVAKIMWNNTVDADCFRQEAVCVAEDWNYSTVPGDNTQCGCQRRIVNTSTYVLEITGDPLTADELRLCSMCNTYLTGG